MITYDKDFSKKYVLHYWFDGEGNTHYYTWDGIVGIKQKLEKQRFQIIGKRFIKALWFLIPITWVTLLILGSFVLPSSFIENGFYHFLNIPTAPIVIATMYAFRSEIKGEDLLSYSLVRFKELYGDEFDLSHGFWKRVKTYKDIELQDRGYLGIREYFGLKRD